MCYFTNIYLKGVLKLTSYFINQTYYIINVPRQKNIFNTAIVTFDSISPSVFKHKIAGNLMFLYAC